jgi:hypothetical protein
MGDRRRGNAPDQVLILLFLLLLMIFFDLTVQLNLSLVIQFPVALAASARIGAPE